MTHEEMIAVIKADQRGEPIQSIGKLDCCDQWCDNLGHNFDFIDFNYRVKPKDIYQPYSNCAELIEDYKSKYNRYGGWTGKTNPMYCPLIWIKDKNSPIRHLITGYLDNTCIYLNKTVTLQYIFENFTYLDGSPIGKKEIV